MKLYSHMVVMKVDRTEGKVNKIGEGRVSDIEIQFNSNSKFLGS